MSFGEGDLHKRVGELEKENGRLRELLGERKGRNTMEITSMKQYESCSFCNAPATEDAFFMRSSFTGATVCERCAQQFVAAVANARSASQQDKEGGGDR